MARLVPVITLASIAWLLLIVAAPIVASRQLEAPWLFRAASLSYVGGAIICHQRPERSFQVAGIPMPVCARCTGLYAAAPLGLLAAMLPAAALVRRHAKPRQLRRVLLLAAAPIAMSIVAERAGLWQPSNLERCLTALPSGFVVAWLAGAAARGYLR